MSPTEISALVAGQQRLEDKLDDSRRAREDEAVRIHSELAEIKAQVKTTNGRVNALEGWRDRLLGGAFVIGVIYAVSNDLLSHFLK